jgi:hypothetical protein
LFVAHLGSDLYDAVFIGRRYAFSALIGVADCVTVFEQEIKFGSRLVDGVGNVVIGHERIDEQLIPDRRPASALGLYLTRNGIDLLDLQRFLLDEARKPSTTKRDGPLGRGTNRSGPNRCSGNVPGLIRLPSVPFLGAFSVGIARKRPRLLRITAPSSNARMICGALV